MWSPVNTGLIVLKPSCRVFRRLAGLIRDRRWTPEEGWEGAGPFPLWRTVDYKLGRDDVPQSVAATRQNLTTNWDFYCSSSDQGLVHYLFNTRRTETCAAERDRWRGSSCVVVLALVQFGEYGPCPPPTTSPAPAPP